MKKEEVVKEILAKLINGNKRIGYYTREQIDKAIIEVRGVDKRTRETWFSVLFKLEYILQPQPDIFNLNLSKVSELELEVPRQIDLKQTRLGGFT